MRLYLRTFLASAVLTLLGAGAASAQVPFNFDLIITAPNQQPARIPNDTLVNLSATSNQVTVTATYTGTTQAIIPGPPSRWLLGSTEFSVSVPTGETFPLVLGPGQQLVFTIQFSAVSSTQVSATLNIPYSEPTTNGTINNAIIIPLNGVSPNVTLAYALAPNNNVVGIKSGDTIQFKPTPLNTTATATLLIANTGSGAAQITGITGPPSTSPFQLAGLPLATPTSPFTLPPGTNNILQIGIQYTPTAVETDTGQITVTFQNGPTQVVNLSGSGATSSFTYSVVGTTTVPVKAGDTITLPAVAVPTGTTSTPPSSSVLIRVKNTGNANGVINSIVAGPNPPFAVTGAPPTTPPTLKPGDTESFSVTFTPNQVGVQKGTLIVGNDTFTLQGTGQGAQLSFAYSSGGATVLIGQTGTVVFPNTQVSQSKTVNFTVTNSGSGAPTTISSVGTSAPFSIASFSPVTLDAGKSTTFAIKFTPTVAGPVSQPLLVNGTQVTLEGVGTAPPNLPSYTISGPSGNVAPATQSSVGLTLANPYPVDLNGVLTLTTSGSLGSDPSVQFVTGGRTVPFVIPANSTSANFAGQGAQIFVQTGTVAETVTLTPTFATTGGADITPQNPTTLQFTIAPAAPVLEGVSVTGATASLTTASFTLVISGYTTTRDLKSLSVTLQAASGFNLTNAQVTEDLTGPSNVWFQSIASQAFGGAFQVSIPFNLTGTAPKNQTLLQAIGAVSATITNSVGSSNALQSKLQ